MRETHAWLSLLPWALNLGVIFELALQLSPISDVSVVSCYGVESPLAHWCSRGSDVKTSDMQIVTECQSIFNFRLPSVIFRISVRHFALSTSLAITRYTSLPCPRCNICCFSNLNALFTVYFVSYIRLIILHIDCILSNFGVYCILFFFVLFLFITRWWIELLKNNFLGSYECANYGICTTAALVEVTSDTISLICRLRRHRFLSRKFFQMFTDRLGCRQSVFCYARHLRLSVGNESVPIQLAQCRLPGRAISDAKI